MYSAGFLNMRERKKKKAADIMSNLRDCCEALLPWLVVRHALAETREREKEKKFGERERKKEKKETENEAETDDDDDDKEGDHIYERIFPRIFLTLSLSLSFSLSHSFSLSLFSLSLSLILSLSLSLSLFLLLFAVVALSTNSPPVFLASKIRMEKSISPCSGKIHLNNSHLELEPILS
jgi:hypothetical protein